MTREFRRMLVAATVTLLLAGCGKGAGEAGGLPALSADETTSTSAAPPRPVDRNVGLTGWYENFAVTLNTVQAEVNAYGSVDLTIQFGYQNLGGDSAEPPLGHLEVDGKVQELTYDEVTVPGKAKATGTATAHLALPDPTAEGSKPAGNAAGGTSLEALLDDSNLVYGEQKDNQTRIPFQATGKVESVEPRSFEVNATIGKPVVVELLGAEYAPSYKTGEKDVYLLTVAFRAICGTDCRHVGYNIDRTSFSLTAPDGTSSNADGRSSWCCDAMYPGVVSEGDRNKLVFVVKNPGEGGTYTFTFIQPGDKKPVTTQIKL